VGMTWGGGAPRRSAGVAVVAALAAMLPGPAAQAAESLPKPLLTQRQVSPSTCPGGPDPLVYVKRPTLTATAGVKVPAGTRLEIEVHQAIAVEYYAQYYGEGPGMPMATARVAPVRAGSRTFSWRPAEKLWVSEIAWRGRLVRAGKPVSAWSSFSRFTVDTTFPRRAECRFDASQLQEARDYARAGGWTLDRQLADDAWQGDFYRLATRISRAHPRAFTAGGATSAHDRRAWLAFRHDAPAGARALVTRFLAAHPGSTVRLLSGRDYTERGMQRRADRILDAALGTELFDPGWSSSGADLRTGTVEVELTALEGSKLTYAELRARALKAVRAQLRDLAVVAPGPGVVAGPDRQPVRVRVFREP
jgi:hypothetical protein